MSRVEEIDARVKELDMMAAGRCDHKGRPKYGYSVNVAMIRDEQRRLGREREELSNGDAV